MLRPGELHIMITAPEITANSKCKGVSANAIGEIILVIEDATFPQVLGGSASELKIEFTRIQKK